MGTFRFTKSREMLVVFSMLKLSKPVILFSLPEKSDKSKLKARCITICYVPKSASLSIDTIGWCTHVAHHVGGVIKLVKDVKKKQKSCRGAYD